MPSLAEHQRAMLALMKGRPVPPSADAYHARIAPSRELALLREIAVWWRLLTIEGACPSAARLLKRLGIFDSSVERFYRDENVSPYIERASEHFLRHTAGHDDPLVRATIAFETALFRIRRREAGPFTIDWDRNPENVLAALDSGAPIPDAEPGAIYRLHLSADRIDYERIAVN